jgi:hypothetical protein
MRRVLVALFLLACLPALGAQEVRYGQEPPKAKPGIDYPVKVHISAVRIRTYCNGNCTEVLHVDAVADQKRLELTGAFLYQLNLVPGDYAARLLKTAHKGAATPIDDEYELLLPDKHIWRCTVTGIFE